MKRYLYFLYIILPKQIEDNVWLGLNTEKNIISIREARSKSGICLQ